MMVAQSVARGDFFIEFVRPQPGVVQIEPLHSPLSADCAINGFVAVETYGGEGQSSNRGADSLQFKYFYRSTGSMCQLLRLIRQ
jgi:hypothetical protein